MDSLLMEVGVAGILIVLVLRQVFDFVGSKNGKNTTECQMVQVSMADLNRKVDDLWQWHAPDSTGEQSWKNAQMIDVVQEVRVTVENNTKLIEKMMLLMERMKKAT